jgi:hypothetical protein
MSGVLLASARSLAASPAELVVLVVTVVLLSIRSWTSVAKVALTRRGTHLLTGLTVLMVVLFFLLVIFRFRTLG